MNIVVVTSTDNQLMDTFVKDNYDRYPLCKFPEKELHPSKHFETLKHWLENGNDFCIMTHSEHIINGLRIYTLIHQGVNVKIFFIKSEANIGIDINNRGDLTSFPRGWFDQNMQDLATLIKLKQGVIIKAKELTIDARGELSEWPDGFFDQAEQDYLDILKFRKNYKL